MHYTTVNSCVHPIDSVPAEQWMSAGEKTSNSFVNSDGEWSFDIKDVWKEFMGKWGNKFKIFDWKET